MFIIFNLDMVFSLYALMPFIPHALYERGTSIMRAMLHNAPPPVSRFDQLMLASDPLPPIPLQRPQY